MLELKKYKSLNPRRKTLSLVTLSPLSPLSLIQPSLSFLKKNDIRDFLIRLLKFIVQVKKKDFMGILKNIIKMKNLILKWFGGKDIN